jgi:hypothetical protein
MFATSLAGIMPEPNLLSMRMVQLPDNSLCATIWLILPLMQAILNTLLSKVHIKKKAGFKPTEKTGGGGATGATAQIQSALMHRLTSLTKRFNQATLPQLYQPQVAPAGELVNLPELN